MRARRFLPYVVLLCWTAILYYPAINHPFVYDDQAQIVANPHLSSPSASLVYWREPALFGDAFGAQSGSFYRPLFWMTLTSDDVLGNRNPAIFHATNVLLHALNGLLLFLLLRRWFSDAVAVAASLLWLSLPIHSEVVAWISGRGLSLSVVFILVSILSALKYAERRSPKWLLLLFLASSAALLSHEAAVVTVLLATAVVFCSSPISDRLHIA